MFDTIYYSYVIYGLLILLNYIAYIDIKVICLQELWLSDENTSLFELPNYVGHGRQCCKHAGLITYVHNSLRFKVIPQSHTMTNWECLSIQITIDNKLGFKLTENDIYNRH